MKVSSSSERYPIASFRRGMCTVSEVISKGLSRSAIRRRSIELREFRQSPRTSTNSGGQRIPGKPLQGFTGETARDRIGCWRNVGEMQCDSSRLERMYLILLALPRGLQGPSNFNGLLTRLATDVPARSHSVWRTHAQRVLSPNTKRHGTFTTSFGTRGVAGSNPAAPISFREHITAEFNPDCGASRKTSSDYRAQRYRH